MHMTGDERRKKIVEMVASASEPITGTTLASTLGVSRQIVVQDMAILRAAGANIIATPRGYVTLAPAAERQMYREVIAVRHGRDLIEAELTSLVDLGLRVVDVIVDHPIYGEIRGHLLLESRADVRSFLERLDQTEPLSTLTRGVHLHTVEARRPEAIEEGKDALRRLGILLEGPSD